MLFYAARVYKRTTTMGSRRSSARSRAAQSFISHTIPISHFPSVLHHPHLPLLHVLLFLSSALDPTHLKLPCVPVASLLIVPCRVLSPWGCHSRIMITVHLWQAAFQILNSMFLLCRCLSICHVSSDLPSHRLRFSVALPE